jgi:hypothetical protein
MTMRANYRLLLLVAFVLLINFHLALRQGQFATPLAVTLEGLSDEVSARARLFAFYLTGSEEEIRPTSPGVWECPPRCTAELVLRYPEPEHAKSGTVRVKIGAETFTQALSDLQPHGAYGENYWLTEKLPFSESPGFARCRNWPGTEAFVTYYLTRSLPGVAAVLLLALAMTAGMRERWRARFMTLFGLTPQAPVASSPASSSRAWNLTGWLFLIFGFAALEWMQPYYFTQDDALVGELPGILLGCRSLWAGTFPDWNPYVFMGAPLATVGFWAITYPPQLIAYAIARHVLGNEFATLEVFAVLHLLAGFAAMRHLCRRIGMSACAANLAALSFVYAGCILIMGRSWHAFVANAVWLPLLGIGIQRFREGPVGWKWIVGIGLVFGLSYHAGFPQIAALLGMFFVIGLAAVAYGDRIPLRRVMAVVPALLLGAGLSAPLLLHHLSMTGGHERFVPAEDGVYDALTAALVPYPLAQAELPTHWGTFHVEKMGHFYYFGGLFALLFLLQFLCFWVYFPGRGAWASCWWLVCGSFALLMVLGEPAYLWKGMAALPLSKFFLRYTFRFYPIVAFCAILAGGLIIERALAMVRRRQPWELLLGAIALCVLTYHLTMCQPSFYSYGFRPYPELPTEFEAVFHPYADKKLVGVNSSRRLASWTHLRSIAPDYYLSLPLNLPHYYQVPSIFGYDPVVEGQPRMAEVYRRLQHDPETACKAYGVGWHLFGYTAAPVFSPNKHFWSMEQTVNFDLAYRRLPQADLKTLATSGGTALMELRGVDPLAFVTCQSERPLPCKLHCRGADIDVSGLPAGTNITINFLWHAYMGCTLGGQTLALAADDWQRITTTIPVTGATLALRFTPPWLKTCIAGAGLCCIALVLAWLALRFGEKKADRSEEDQ